MASMRDIKRRKSSIQSTQQITKAMKLVSTVKLQRTKQRAEQSKTYFESMYKTVTSMLSKTGGLNHPYLKAGASEKKAVIVITSNRGLAGGYNNNIVKEITNAFSKDETDIYALGKKGLEGLANIICLQMTNKPIEEEAQAYLKAGCKEDLRLRIRL